MSPLVQSVLSVLFLFSLLLSLFSPLPSLQQKILDTLHISDFEELNYLKELNLQELVLSNNPVCVGLDDVTYRQYKISLTYRSDLFPLPSPSFYLLTFSPSSNFFTNILFREVVRRLPEL